VWHGAVGEIRSHPEQKRAMEKRLAPIVRRARRDGINPARCDPEASLRVAVALWRQLRVTVSPEERRRVDRFWRSARRLFRTRRRVQVLGGRGVRRVPRRSRPRSSRRRDRARPGAAAAADEEKPDVTRGGRPGGRSLKPGAFLAASGGAS
jgi:hypothetical protein